MAPLSSRSLALARTVDRAVFEAAFAVGTLYSARPAFASLHLPLQDLPQHMAAVSILRRYAFEPGLHAYFELALSRTQYLLVYVLGVLLSAVTSTEYAMRLILAGIVVATPYALRFALSRTGGEPRLAAMSWPFAWNPQAMLGFLNFTLGFPLALLGIGLFADADWRRTRRGGIVLACVALATFYAHLIPFGILGLGMLAQLHTAPAGTDRRVRTTLVTWARDLACLAPTGLAFLVFVLRSPARDASIRAGGVSDGAILTWPDRLALPAEFRDTILQAHGTGDEAMLLVWGLGLLLAAAAAGGIPARGSASRRVALLPLVCAALYLLAPASYGWIWPIHTRFAVAAVLLLPLAFRAFSMPSAGTLLTLALLAVVIPFTTDLSHAFQRWDQDELGPLDEVLSRAQPHRRLVALVPPFASSHVQGNVPLLHAAAYYQVRGGDVATFSFADFPQSPFRFREDGPRPPRLAPRWEWQTSLDTADPAGDYYDYVLVREGAHDDAAAHPERYHRVTESGAWRLYERSR